MSQAKVDKYKKEKKNRAKELKKKKVKKVIWVFIGALVVGAAIGFPLGKKLYKVSVEKREASATISVEAYDYWMQQYWAVNYPGMFSSTDDSYDSLFEDIASDTDASNTDASISE